MEKKSNGISRREFLSYSALGLASLTILPSWAQNGVKVAPSDRVVMGFIGLGRQCLSDFSGFSKVPGVQVAAGCDVDSMKRERFAQRIMNWQAETGQNQRCDTYEFYEDMLSRKDIDAIEVVTPDHWHALCAIHAMQAGKDVYCQKPLTYTITEALAVKDATRALGKVFQTGSQQRSQDTFQQAIRLVQAGAIGHIDKVYCKVGDPPQPLNLPEMPVPANLNFNQWLGPLNDPKIHYHPDLCPPIVLEEKNAKGKVVVAAQNEKLWGAWRWYSETGNGYPADWGAHMYDIANAALGFDGSGPVEYTPAGYKGQPYDTMKYANGIVMSEQPFREDRPTAQGIQFVGDKGWIKVARGFIEASDPNILKSADEGGSALAYEISTGHMGDFINCVRSRKNPIAPVEAGCSTAIICCMTNIARELKRPVRWNPATLCFDGDQEARNHRLYYYEYRAPYKLPYLQLRNA